MRDKRGYQAYLRLRRGWRYLSLALFGLACAAVLSDCRSWGQLGHPVLMLSLGTGAWGAMLAASGSLVGSFRKICLMIGLHFLSLLLAQGSATWLWGLPWLSLLTCLWLADRGLRNEMGLCRAPFLLPPGCLIGMILLPFFWPLAIFFATVCLCVYMIFSYAYLAGAMPRPDELVGQLNEPQFQALDAITRI